MTTDDVALLIAAERAITAYLDAWDVMHLCLVNTKETTYTIMGWGVNALLAIHEDGTVWAYCRDDVNGYVGPAAATTRGLPAVSRLVPASPMSPRSSRNSPGWSQDRSNSGPGHDFPLPHGRKHIMTFPDNSTLQIAQIITQEYPSAKVFCDGRRVRLGYVSATVSPRGAIICTSGAAPEYASQGRTPADIADEIVSLHCTDTRINPARRAWRLSPDWEFTQGDDYSDVTARRGDLTVTMRPHGDFRYRVNTPDGREIIQFAGSRAVRTLVDQCVRLARHD